MTVCDRGPWTVCVCLSTVVASLSGPFLAMEWKGPGRGCERNCSKTCPVQEGRIALLSGILWGPGRRSQRPNYFKLFQFKLFSNYFKLFQAVSNRFKPFRTLPAPAPFLYPSCTLPGRFLPDPSVFVCFCSLCVCQQVIQRIAGRPSQKKTPTASRRRQRRPPPRS